MLDYEINLEVFIIPVIIDLFTGFGGLSSLQLLENQIFHQSTPIKGKPPRQAIVSQIHLLGPARSCGHLGRVSVYKKENHCILKFVKIVINSVSPMTNSMRAHFQKDLSDCYLARMC